MIKRLKVRPFGTMFLLRYLTVASGNERLGEYGALLVARRHCSLLVL